MPLPLISLCAPTQRAVGTGGREGGGKREGPPLALWKSPSLRIFHVQGIVPILSFDKPVPLCHHHCCHVRDVSVHSESSSG